MVVSLPFGVVRDPKKTTGAEQLLLALTQLEQLPAAVALMLTTKVVLGARAVSFATPSIVLMAVIAIAGLLSELSNVDFRTTWELCRYTGLVFFAVSGACGAVDRGGMNPFGFCVDIMQLVAVILMTGLQIGLAVNS